MKKILPVDFQDVNNDTLARWKGYSASTVLYAHEAIKELPKEPFAALVMDIAGKAYDGPAATIIRFRAIENPDPNMMDKLLLMKEALLVESQIFLCS